MGGRVGYPRGSWWCCRWQNLAGGERLQACQILNKWSQLSIRSEGGSNKKREGRNLDGKAGFGWGWKKKGSREKQENSNRFPPTFHGVPENEQPKYTEHKIPGSFTLHLPPLPLTVYSPLCSSPQGHRSSQGMVDKGTGHEALGLTPSLTSWATTSTSFNLRVPEVTHLENGVYDTHSLHLWLAVRKMWESKPENVLIGNFIP